MAEDKKHFAFFAIRKPDEGPLPTFAFGQREYIDGVLAQWAEGVASAEVGAANSPQAAHESEFTHESALTEALKASVNFGLAQYELIEAASITPILMRISILRGKIFSDLEKSCDEISSEESSTLYGMTETQYAEMIKEYDRYIQAKNGFERFPSATLLSLVATFDTLVVDILSKMLRLQNEWLQRSERTVSLARLATATNLEEIIQEQISEEVYQFSRGSHSEQAEYIKKNFGIDIASDWKRWPDYIEIFERRNLVAHGEPMFNARYVRICKAAGHKGSEELLGKNVELRTAYLRQSLNILIEFSSLLSFSLFRKFVKEIEEQAFTNLNEAVFKLIQTGHYLVAERLSDYALNLKKVKVTTETRLMLIVNKASAVGHQGRIPEATKILDSEDWSAVSDIFKICVSSLKKDGKEFHRLLQSLASSETLTVQSVLTWPCFSFMRDDKAGQKAIKDVFGIDVSKEQGDVVSGEPSSIEDNSDLISDNLTKH